MVAQVVLSVGGLDAGAPQRVDHEQQHDGARGEHELTDAARDEGGDVALGRRLGRVPAGGFAAPPSRLAMHAQEPNRRPTVLVS